MISHSRLLQACISHAESTPNKEALVSDSDVCTYFQLHDRILRAAAFLYEMGLGKGDTILLSARKELEFVYLYFAAHALGMVNVVVDTSLNQERIEYIISLVKPKVFFTSTHNEVGVSCLTYKEMNLPSEPLDFSVFPHVESDDVADIMFTTGTTGNPKGVCLSHANIAGSAQNINSFIGNGASDVEVLGLPLSHSFGLGRLRCGLLQGSTIVLLGNFANIKSFFQAIESHHATMFAMVPAVWQYIRRFSGIRIGKYASQIRFIEIGSASMGEEDKRLLMQLFPHTRICMHYGLTEASRAFFMEFHESETDLNTIGCPSSPLVEAAVFDEEGHRVSDGECGELCVKGNMVMNSYFLSDDNKEAFWGDYFRTGDYGYRSSSGQYYLIGRKKEVINIGGNKVSPSLIEEAIIKQGFADCACVPIPDPDGVLGEVPKAFVVKGNSEMDVHQLITKLSSVLEPYQVPRQIEWIENVPRTSSGKIQRLSLLQN